MLYKGRNSAIKFYDDYYLMATEGRHKTTKEKARKILTPKQMI